MYKYNGCRCSTEKYYEQKQIKKAIENDTTNLLCNDIWDLIKKNSLYSECASQKIV